MVSQLTKASRGPECEPVRIVEPIRPTILPGAVAPDAIGVHSAIDGSHSMDAYHQTQRTGVLNLKQVLVSDRFTKTVPIYFCETLMSGPPESTGFVPIARFEPTKGAWGFDSPHDSLFDRIVAENRKFLAAVRGRVLLINIISVDGQTTGGEAQMMAAIERLQRFEKEVGSHTFVAELPGAVTRITGAISATHKPKPLPTGNYAELFEDVFKLLIESATDINAPAKMETIDRRKTAAAGGE